MKVDTRPMTVIKAEQAEADTAMHLPIGNGPDCVRVTPADIAKGFGEATARIVEQLEDRINELRSDVAELQRMLLEDR